MKHFYLLLLLAGWASIAQDLQNANWFFSQNAGVSFMPNITFPVTITGSQSTSFESNAAVSDSSGNLLFYTDGVTVWDYDHSIMLNGENLKGHMSNTQIVIVPRPESKSYYIVTIDGLSGDQKGLYWSEVVIDGNGNFVVEATKNTPLHDHNDVPIVEFYGSPDPEIYLGIDSEKITSTVHCNGIDYWVVTQIGEYIYSYLVTNDGISTTPVSYSLASFPIELQSSAGPGQMKISPDSKRIGIAYSKPYWTGITGAVALGDFDNSSGDVTFDNDLITIANPIFGSFYGLEFSPQGKYVYFTCDQILYRCNGEIATPSSVEPIYNFEVNVAGLQLALNGKIYVSYYFEEFLHVINNPDADTVTLDAANTANISPSYTQAGLPQWVHWQEGVCKHSVTFSYPDGYYIPHIYRYASYIKTDDNYSINAGQRITMKAGDYIQLLPNTTINSGSVFLAEIEECEICSTPSQQRHKAETLSDAPDLVLSPNPAATITEITAKEQLSNITITGLDGKVILQQDIMREQNSYTIDVARYPKGIYIVNVTTKTGNNFSEKLIIN